MDEMIVLENRVDCQCVRHVHLMSNQEPDELVRLRYAPRGAGWIATREVGVWHCRVSYPYKGMLDVAAAVPAKKKFRRLVVWNLEGCGSVRNAIGEAFTYFWALFKFQPGYVFIKKLPTGVEHGQEFEGLILIEADWMLERCVAVGGMQ